MDPYWIRAAYYANDDNYVTIENDCESDDGNQIWDECDYAIEWDEIFLEADYLAIWDKATTFPRPHYSHCRDRAHFKRHCSRWDIQCKLKKKEIVFLRNCSRRIFRFNKSAIIRHQKATTEALDKFLTVVELKLEQFSGANRPQQERDNHRYQNRASYRHHGSRRSPSRSSSRSTRSPSRSNSRSDRSCSKPKQTILSRSWSSIISW